MAIPSLPVRRCALCGRQSRINLFAFPLLAEVCRGAGVKLKASASDRFHEPCSRKAFCALSDKADQPGRIR